LARRVTMREEGAEAPVDGDVAADGAAEVAGEARPCLYYFPAAGRGELSRLIAAVGGLEIDEVPDVDDKASFGSPGMLPALVHGELRISQSFAIECYIASIAPAFANLDAVQRAVDNMFCRIKEDVLQGFVDIVRGVASDDSKKASAADDIAAVGDKWFPIIEGRLPEGGFINSLEIPTVADLAVFNISTAFIPFGKAYKMGAYDVSAKFPKFAAHALRVAEHPSVQAYVDKSATMGADLLAPGGSQEAGKAGPPAQGKEEAASISALALETAELWHAVDCPVPDCAIVWLHGLGETEVYWQELFEMEDILHIPELGDCRWIMPRADNKPCSVRGGASTFQWFDTFEYPICLMVPGVPDGPRKEEDPAEIYQAVHRVHEAVLALEVEGVPADKIVIAGFGQGGALAVHAALSYPKTLAGVAMLSGYVPCTSALKEALTPGGSNLELLWLHGVHDAVVFVDAATAEAKELSEWGIRLDFRLSFDYGHDTTTEGLKGFRHWLIEKMKPPPEEVEEEEEPIEDVPVSEEPHVHTQDPWGAAQRAPSHGAHSSHTPQRVPSHNKVH